MGELKEGQNAPDFSLSSDGGKNIRLSDYKGKNVVLYFYPKDMTPGCTQEACDFRDAYKRLRSSETEVFGVSFDAPDSHVKFKEKYKLPFPLLSDEDKAVARDYGVYKQKSLYGKSYMGIERTTFLIGPDQKIKKIFPKVKVSGHIQEVLESLKATKSERSAV